MDCPIQQKPKQPNTEIVQKAQKAQKKKILNRASDLLQQAQAATNNIAI